MFSLQPSDSDGNCDSLRFSLRFLFAIFNSILFASQMWATRPHLANIFEKLLDQKTFSCLRQYSWKTTRIRFGKAGAHPQLAFEIAIAPETLFHVTTFRLWRQLRFFRFPLRFLLLLIIHSLQGAAYPLHPSPS